MKPALGLELPVKLSAVLVIEALRFLVTGGMSIKSRHRELLVLPAERSVPGGPDKPAVLHRECGILSGGSLARATAFDGIAPESRILRLRT